MTVRRRNRRPRVCVCATCPPECTPKLISATGSDGFNFVTLETYSDITDQSVSGATIEVGGSPRNVVSQEITSEAMIISFDGAAMNLFDTFSGTAPRVENVCPVAFEGTVTA